MDPQSSMIMQMQTSEASWKKLSSQVLLKTGSVYRDGDCDIAAMTTPQHLDRAEEILIFGFQLLGPFKSALCRGSISTVHLAEFTKLS